MIHLSKGTILDNRYEILELLGEGGFGITYAARNKNNSATVAIKEFFWRGYLRRDTEENGTFKVDVIDSSNQEKFISLKEKFLQEARILKDFDKEPAVVRIYDYFEANGTAYMVMEYIDGLTLRNYVKENGAFTAPDLFRKTLPLIQTLSHIHKTGIIHRDISPDNIMIQKDGTLKLLDFGTARKYNNMVNTGFTAIARDNYAPAEQYDKNGNQGPWTDVYALCAVLYECLTLCPPDSSVQRMFLDELKSPSACGISIDSAYEDIIMKGLKMAPEERFSSMDDLYSEIRKILPDPETEAALKKKKRFKIMISAVLTGTALVIAFLIYHQYDITHRFRNVETEKFKLTPMETLTDEQFSSALSQIESSLTALTDGNNYDLTTDENCIYVELPLSYFNDREIDAVLEDEILKDNAFYYEYEIKADWEEPGNSIVSGKNQTSEKNVSGTTVTQIFTYISGSESAGMTNGEWSNVITDIKTRLDALDTPYAIGTLYGNDQKLVIKIRASETGSLVNDTLGSNPQFTLEGKFGSGIGINASNAVFESSETESGTRVLDITLTDDSDQKELENYIDTLRGNSEDTLYLCVDGVFYSGINIDDIRDGSLSFDTFYIDYINDSETEAPPFTEYLCALANDTDIPSSYVFDQRLFRDENGDPIYGADGRSYYGLNISEKNPAQSELEALAEQMQNDGYDVILSKNTDPSQCLIYLNKTPDETFISDSLSEIKDIIEKYDLKNIRGQFVFYMTEENDDCIAHVYTNRLTVNGYPPYGDRIIDIELSGSTIEPYTKNYSESWDEFISSVEKDGFVSPTLKLDSVQPIS